MQSFLCWLYAKFSVLAICKVCGAGKTVRAGMLFCCAFACKKHPRTDGPMKHFCNRDPSWSGCHFVREKQHPQTEDMAVGPMQRTIHFMGRLLHPSRETAPAN